MIISTNLPNLGYHDMVNIKKDPSHYILRIDSISATARSVWLAILASNIYVLLIIFNFDPVDFWGIEQNIKLPVVPIEVPTRQFFFATPILLTAVYCYLHFLLIQLWDSLGQAPSLVKGVPIGDAVKPFLIVETALGLRRRLRRDESVEPRMIDAPALVVNILLTWVLGLVVLGEIWRLVAAGRSLGLELASAISLSVAGGVAVASLSMLWLRMAADAKSPRLPRQWLFIAPLLVFAAATISISWSRTFGQEPNLSSLKFVGVELSKRPDDWKPYLEARSAFAKVNCDGCNTVEIEESWLKFRVGKIEKIPQPNLNPYTSFDLEDLRYHDERSFAEFNEPLEKEFPDSPNFSKSAFLDVFWVGANLIGTRLDNVKIQSSDFESADLRAAKMGSPIISDSNFANASFMGFSISDGNISDSSFINADFRLSTVSSSVIYSANFQNADFRSSKISSKINFSDLRGSKLKYADLTGSQLHVSLLDGIVADPIDLELTTFYDTSLVGSALRRLSFSLALLDSSTDLSTAFLDGSVDIDHEQAGLDMRPCQWVDEILDDIAYFGYWRGWLEESFFIGEFTQWSDIAPLGYENVPAIGPPDGCNWPSP